MVPNAVEKQIVTLRTSGEILPGVIDDLIRAEGSNHVHIPRTAYAGNIRAERLGNLHSERAYAARRTVDQDLLTRLKLPFVAKSLQCGECRYRRRSRLLKRHVVRLYDQRRLGSARIFGKCPKAKRPAEHVVAGFEPCYVAANRFNLAGHIKA